MNLLDYTLNLQDQMSASLDKIGAKSKIAKDNLLKLQTQADEVERHMHGTAGSVGALRKKLDLLRAGREIIPAREIKAIRTVNKEVQKLERQINKLETTSGSRTGRWMREAFDNVPFAGLLLNPLVIAGAAAGKAISLGIQQDMQNTSFEVLLGSKESAKKLVDDIAKFAEKTPFGKQDLGQNAKTMLSFGIDEGQVMPFLNSLGDVAMGDKNKMASLTLAFSQMSSTGKLMGQDLNQMINAGFNPLEEISRKTGKSIGQLRNDMSKGILTTKIVQDAFVSATSEGGKYNGMMEKMSNTLGGKFSTFMDNVSEKFLILYKYIGPVAGKILELGNTALDATFNGIGWMVEKLEQGHPVAVVLASVLGSVTTALILMKAATIPAATWSGIMTFMKKEETLAWLANAKAMLMNPATWIVAGVIALIATIGYLIYRVDGWGQAWEKTVSAVEYLWGGFTSYFKTEWLDVEDSLINGIDKIMIAWNRLKSLWNKKEANEALIKMKTESEERTKVIESGRRRSHSLLKKGASEFGKAVGSFSVNDNSLGDLKNGAFKALGLEGATSGISAPSGIPGANQRTVDSTLGDGQSKAGRSKTNNAIATGGVKHNYVTINLESLINGLKIEGKGFKESASEMTNQTVDALLRVVAMANTAT